MKSVVCVVILVCALFVMADFVQFPVSLILLFIATSSRSSTLHRLFARYTSQVISVWLKIVSFVIEAGYGVKYYVYEERRNGENALCALGRDSSAMLVMNHRTRLDWLMLWPILARANGLAALRIIAKDALRWVPLLGPAIQVGRFLFLQRRWELDAAHATSLYALLRYGPRGAQQCPPPYRLLIFPEGTDLHPAAAHKSAAFASSRGLPATREVLLPRVRGLAHALHSLAGPPRADSGWGSECTLASIIDITVAYEGGIPQREPALLGEGSVDTASNGRPMRMPSAMHIHLSAWKSNEIAPSLLAHCGKGSRVVYGHVPSNVEKEVESWLFARFAAKEAALRVFYGLEDLGLAPVLDLIGAESCLSACSGDMTLACAALLERHTRNGGNVALTARPAASPAPWASYATSIAFCLTAAALVLYVTVHWTALVAMYLVGLTIVLHVVVPLVVKGGGLDTVELALFSPVPA